MSNTHHEKAQLLDLYMKGNLKAVHLQEFLDFIQTAEGQELLKENMNQTDFSVVNNDQIPINKSQRDRIYQQIGLQIKQPGRNFKLVFRIAASFLLFIALGVVVYYMKPFHNQSTVVSVEVLGDKRQNVILPDGTYVRLNRGCRLLYFPDMNRRKMRQVTLVGEAFFEVAKNPGKPFIIDVGKAEVRVLGTKFNIKTMSQKSAVVVAVKEGKVSFKGDQQSKGITLTANEVGILEANKDVKKIEQPAQNYFSWFEQYLDFENMPLPQVVEQLERIFDIEIEISDSDLNNKHFTAYMRKVSVDEALNQLAFSLELTLKKVNGKYFLKH